MLNVRAEVNLDEITDSLRQTLRQIVENTAITGQVLWIDAVQKAPLSPYDKANYRASIQYRMTGDYKAELFADYRFAAEIETGRPARDLKKNLQTSQRTRAAKQGKHAGQRYLIIPFRHNIPGYTAHADAMPKPIYLQAKALTASSVTGMKSRLSASGHVVPQRVYQWGERLPAGLAEKLKPHHSTDIYAGMVRFNTSAGKAKSSAYLTFRVMGEWQANKWIIPPQPGLFLAKAVATDLDTVLQQAIKTIE